MKSYKLSELKRNYFVGNFSPTAYSSENVEVCTKKYRMGTLDAHFFREKNVQLVYVINGKIEVDDVSYTTGSIIVWEAGELINIYAEQDSDLLIMKFPGGADYIQGKFGSYEEADSFYRKYYLKTKDKYDRGIRETKKVNHQDITVVIQGYVDEKTYYAVQSVRKYLPGAAIVLSTWENSDISDMDVDQVVLSKDPGAIECSRWEELSVLNNGNRQIISTQAGFKAVKTKYALKLRSDLLLLGNQFLNYYKYKETERNEDFKLFQDRIIIGELFTRDSFVYYREGKRFSVPKPFHPSDWFAFGLTSDLLALYEDVPLIPVEEMANYKCKYPERVENNYYKYSWRYCTEQHIFLACVRKRYPDLLFEDWTDWTKKNIDLSKKLITNNFQILNFMQHQILNQKYVPTTYANSGLRHPERMLITHEKFISRVKQYESHPV